MSENIKASEISDVLRMQLEGIDTDLRFEEVGTVLQVSDGVVRIYGLQNAEANELLEFDNGIRAVVMNLEEDNVGAVLLGPLAGGILGAVFGLSSMWINTTAPGLLAFAFSPFMSTTGLPGALKAVWIAVGCRILIGVVSGWLWIALKRVRVNDYIALPVVGVAGAMTNTVLVMGSIYFLLAQQYAEVKNVALDAVFGLVMATVTASGIPEAIAAAVLVTAVGKALLRLTGTVPQRGLARESGASES